MEGLVRLGFVTWMEVRNSRALIGIYPRLRIPPSFECCSSTHLHRDFQFGLEPGGNTMNRQVLSPADKGVFLKLRLHRVD